MAAIAQERQLWRYQEDDPGASMSPLPILRAATVVVEYLVMVRLLLFGNAAPPPFSAGLEWFVRGAVIPAGWVWAAFHERRDLFRVTGDLVVSGGVLSNILILWLLGALMFRFRTPTCLSSSVYGRNGFPSGGLVLLLDYKAWYGNLSVLRYPYCNDCADFVSQIMHAGNIPTDSQWYPATTSNPTSTSGDWYVVSDLANYMVNTMGYWASTTYSSVLPGGTVVEPDYGHTELATYNDGSTLLYDSHTSDRKEWNYGGYGPLWSGALYYNVHDYVVLVD